MRAPCLALALPALLFLSGCCGGYSVVSTRFAERAELRPGDEQPVVRGNAYVLHYSRLGEPANTCGAGLQYLEHLYLRLPSLQAGQTYTIGASGVTASYSREQGEQGGQGRPATGAKSITGMIEIVELADGDVRTSLEVVITLPSGDEVELDDAYDFHPLRD